MQISISLTSKLISFANWMKNIDSQIVTIMQTEALAFKVQDCYSTQKAQNCLFLQVSNHPGSHSWPKGKLQEQTFQFLYLIQNVVLAPQLLRNETSVKDLMPFHISDVSTKWPSSLNNLSSHCIIFLSFFLHFGSLLKMGR